ncbi:MAG: hypothetical protein Q8R91_09485 [Candidatus Omnitrophota bacterium]|nr:hypothetical protein [Candidatus Omnitrophota bacterium]
MSLAEPLADGPKGKAIMLQANNFKSLSYLLSIFTPQLNFSSNTILTELMTGFGNVLDGQLMSLPLPPDAPPEIPRLTLPSADQRLKLEISPLRTNLFRSRTKSDANVNAAEFLALAGRIFERYMQVTNAVVGRLSSVVVKYEAIQRPGIEIATHFCKEERLTTVLNRPENFEIHAHKVYEPHGFKVNSWVRTKTGFLRPENEPIVVIEHDLNTLHEELAQRRFDTQDIKRFHQVADDQHESVLVKYFPSNA